jgi:hypothetical protein
MKLLVAPTEHEWSLCDGLVAVNPQDVFMLLSSGSCRMCEMPD